jgi:hypothetical protein
MAMDARLRGAGSDNIRYSSFEAAYFIVVVVMRDRWWSLVPPFSALLLYLLLFSNQGRAVTKRSLNFYMELRKGNTGGIQRHVNIV